MKNSNKKYYRSIYLLISLLITIISCDTNEPPIPPDTEKPTLSLTLEDVSCIEAWIKLTTTNLELTATLTLKQFNPNGDTISQILNLNTQDSLLYIDSLLPNKNYQYQVSSIQHQVLSNVITAATLDTTSHDFTFDSFTFGGTAGSSVLYDCVIISPENIWAVGEILVADTSQNGYTMYNAVHWDGVEWKLHRIMFYTICGQQDQNAYAASSIFAFSENDIWVGMQGSQIARLNDTTQISTQCVPISVRKLWGSDNQNIYAVGVNGQIAYYNGSLWTRIESGTDLNIYDIWVEYNNNKSNYEINLVAAQQFVGPERKILTLRNNVAEELSTLNISPGSIHGIWFKTGRKYFITGNGIYFKTNIYDSNDWNTSLSSLTAYYTYAIRGSSLNNIFICGSYGELLHFNGASWKSFKNTPGFFDADFFNIAVKDGLVTVVGQRFSSGFITIGKLQ
jgi:hypothetical protein